MINIIQRGGIHRTKHDFGPFNRKHAPKRNKKRALIVHRGVYSEHSFSGLNSPSRYRGMKHLMRNTFLARQGLKRLGRAMAHSMRLVSSREGFVRRLLKSQPEPVPKPDPFSGFNRYRTVKIESDRVLQPGEAIVCLPDGTFEPFLGRGATPHYGEPYEEDYVDTLSIAFGLPKDFLVPRHPERQSMGFKCKMPANGDQSVQRDLDVSNGEVRVRDKVPGRTIKHLAPGFDFITDTIHRPIEGELLDPVGKGWRIVKASELLSLRLPIEGETVNETDTNKEVMMTDSKRDILHIVVEGDADWTPTQEDMKLISELFQDAVESDKPGIIVTRSGITASVLSVSEGVEVKITKAQVTQADMAKRIDSTAPEDCVATHPAHPGNHDDIDAVIAESQAELDSKDQQ